MERNLVDIEIMPSGEYIIFTTPARPYEVYTSDNTSGPFIGATGPTGQAGPVGATGPTGYVGTDDYDFGDYEFPQSGVPALPEIYTDPVSKQLMVKIGEEKFYLRKLKIEDPTETETPEVYKEPDSSYLDFSGDL